MQPSGQKLPASHLQSLLDSADNASEKGAQQFFLLPEYAAALTAPLPSIRQPGYGDARLVIGDLTGCGDGALITALRKRFQVSDTYGIDIDPRLTEGHSGHHHRLATGDITRFAPLLSEVKWDATLLGLNPPFSLNWHTDRLAPMLGESKTLRVSRTWERYVTQPGAKTIDSTLASYLIGLDRLQSCGEGFLVTLWSTWERLLAPTPAAEHVWLTTRIPKGGRLFNPQVGDYDIAVIYFAADHRYGDPQEIVTPAAPSAELLLDVFTEQVDRSKRSGMAPRYDAIHETKRRSWSAACSEYAQRHDAEVRPEWNLFLRRSGRIGTYLTPFQQVTGHLPSEAIGRLQELDDQTPMGLSVQRNTRTLLLQTVHESNLWRVEPALIAAVERAVADYQTQRAPLYPLPTVQRLGYLDEEDRIECLVDGLGPFKAGQRYPIETDTEEATFHTTILDASGNDNDVQRKGRELVLTVYLDEKRDLNDAHKFILGGKYEYERTPKPDDCDYVHTFADLVDHFRIPEVDDIAALQPAAYQENLAAIATIEGLINHHLQALAV